MLRMCDIALVMGPQMSSHGSSNHYRLCGIVWENIFLIVSQRTSESSLHSFAPHCFFYGVIVCLNMKSVITVGRKVTHTATATVYIYFFCLFVFVYYTTNCTNKSRK